jgi:3-phenylpropionate/cinnamic acid dioxygenase small subunit
MTEAELIRFVRHEARLLDERRWEEWQELFAEDGFYWVPLTHGQTDPLNHTSLAYEDRLLLRLRVERLREGPFSQHPASRSQHVLQVPEIEPMQGGLHVTRTAFLYVEVRGDDQQVHAGTVFHHLRATPEGLRIVLKRVNLLGCESALPSLQLFP